ncbi:MAG: hypothetical protein GDA42_01290 [Ekhidna sp.]|nr:hypothetical protein [Ekhidna sp.]
MKKIIFSFLSMVFSVSMFAQSDLTFYHFGAATPQSGMLNPSFFPDAKYYFSLPALSGIYTNANIGFRYNDLMVPVEGTDSVKVDLERVLRKLKAGDNLSLRGDLSLLQFGMRTGAGNFSLFFNLRYDGGFRYPVSFLEYFIYGNGGLVGESVEEEDLSGGGIAYHEIGVGYSRDVVILGDKNLTIGGRMKYITGLAHASTSGDASLTLFTNPNDYSISATFNNATYRTAGFNDIRGDNVTSYLASNKNKGFAIDVGAQLEINEKLNASLAINDIGWITWKQDIENYTLTNNQISLDGFENLDDIDLAQALEDSIDVWSERETTRESFTTSTGTRIIAGANYRVLPDGIVSGSLYRNGSSYGKSEIGFGAGYTHQFGKTLTLSATVLKEQSRPVEAGFGFVVRAGACQIYNVFDDIFNVVKDPADFQSASFRFGINFLIRGGNTEKKQKEELSPFPPEYDLDYLLDDGNSDNN